MIKPGDVFKDKDKRHPERYVKVIEASDDASGYAKCAPCRADGCLIAGRTTSIRIWNLKQRFQEVGMPEPEPPKGGSER